MDSGSLFWLATLALIAFVLIKNGVYIISQQEAIIIERLGKYHATLESGLNIIFPLLVITRPLAGAVIQLFLFSGLLRYTRNDALGKIT